MAKPPRLLDPWLSGIERQRERDCAVWVDLREVRAVVYDAGKRSICLDCAHNSYDLTDIAPENAREIVQRVRDATRSRR